MAIDGGTFFNENSRTLAPEAVGSQVAIMSIVSVSYIAPKVPMCLKPRPLSWLLSFCSISYALKTRYDNSS